MWVCECVCAGVCVLGPWGVDGMERKGRARCFFLGELRAWVRVGRVWVCVCFLRPPLIGRCVFACVWLAGVCAPPR